MSMVKQQRPESGKRAPRCSWEHLDLVLGRQGSLVDDKGSRVLTHGEEAADGKEFLAGVGRGRALLW